MHDSARTRGVASPALPQPLLCSCYIEGGRCFHCCVLLRLAACPPILCQRRPYPACTVRAYLCFLFSVPSCLTAQVLGTLGNDTEGYLEKRFRMVSAAAAANLAGLAAPGRAFASFAPR